MRRIFSCGAVLGVAILAACGGGGGGSSSPVPSAPLPIASASAAPGTTTFAASDAVAIPTAAPGATSVPVPLASDPGGASASAALSASASVPADTTVESAYASSADPLLPALGARRTPREEAKHGIAFLRLRFSADVSLPQAPAFSFTVPGTFAPSATYWLALYDPLRVAAGWQHGWEGPATVTATTVNGKPATQFAFASNGKPIAFAANETYWLALEAVVPGTATPTPVPSSVPSNPPHEGKPGPVVPSPAVVAFTSVTSAPLTVTFSQQGYTGAFTLHGDCTGVVNTSGSSPTFTLTPVGAGRCVVIGIGDRGASGVVHVGVVTAPETPRPRTSESPKPHESESPAPHGSESPKPHESESPEPGRSASPEPSHSAEPSKSPAPEPSKSSAPEPSKSPAPEPSRSPAPEPSKSPAPEPSKSPAPEPSRSPELSPSPSPSTSPT